MAGINKVILVGNLGRDPEIRTLENGAKVASFSLATSETFKGKDGQRQEQTEWHNVVMWRGLAEVAEKYLKKGTQIFVEGKLRTRNWEDKDGHKRYTTEIIGDNFKILSRKEDNAMPTETNNNNSTEQSPPPATEQLPNESLPDTNQKDANDDLPF